MSVELEQIAYTLYLSSWLNSDEYIEHLSDARLKRLGEKWRKEWLPFRESNHDGDCTNMPYSCIRCSLDELFSTAERILNSNK